MKRVLLVRRKGFNYYTDYTELYLHRAFENYGYSIIREKEKSSLSVLVYISENEKYMSFVSPFFDSPDEAEIQDLCGVFAEAFKSEVMMTEKENDFGFSGDKYLFMLSDKYSAFDEPMYLTEGKPKLELKTADTFFKTNDTYFVRFVSIGGKLSGVKICVEFEEKVEDIKLEEAEISYYKGKQEIYEKISFDKVGNSFVALADFLEINEGINPKSAVLRAKKLMREEERHGFCLKFIPRSSQKAVFAPTIKVLSDDEEIFRRKLEF